MSDMTAVRVMNALDSYPCMDEDDVSKCEYNSKKSNTRSWTTVFPSTPGWYLYKRSGIDQPKQWLALYLSEDGTLHDTWGDEVKEWIENGEDSTWLDIQP